MTPEQRIAQLEAELAAQRTEMQDFSYTVSHDLRASLRHILSYAQLVQEDAAELLPPEALGFLNTISDSARHMGLLMDGLMELSRLGTVALELAPLSTQDLLTDVVAELMQGQAQRPVQWHIASDLPDVLADAALLRASLRHGLDNALKFTAQRAPAQIAVTAEGPAADGLVTLCIQDNGAGFNPALKSKLFHPFQRLHSAKQFAGIGMGLALTRKMVQRMGGGVAADSAVDAGCSLRISLPAVPAPAAS